MRGKIVSGWGGGGLLIARLQGREKIPPEEGIERQRKEFRRGGRMAIVE